MTNRKRTQIDRIRAVPIWLRRTLIGKWRVVLGQRLPEEEMAEQLLEGSIPSFGYFFMLALSAVIATLGLISNSSAIIIGAMIIAPLKSPIDTLSYGLVHANIKLIRRALWTLASGIVTTVLIAFFLSISVGLRFAGHEILSRGNPNLLDLGVALAAGAAGAFSLTRRNISGAPAGVAIAVALVPPLCVMGIGLGFGDHMSASHVARIGDVSLAVGSGLLFFTNLVAIAFSGGFVFLLQSYGNLKKSIPGMLIAFACVFAVVYPLGFSLREILVQNRAKAAILQIAARDHRDWSEKAYILSTEIALRNRSLFGEIYVTSPDDLIKQEEIEKIQQELSSKLNIPVDMEVHILPYTTIAVHPY